MSYTDNAIKLRAAINSAGAMLTDEQAATVPALYPAWSGDGVSYGAGDRVQYGDSLYKCLQSHVSQPDWTPEAAASLWTRIDETHAGTEGDPIPYETNMQIYNGLYYSQYGILYRCIRDSGQPLYHDLANLVGLYVEVVA